MPKTRPHLSITLPKNFVFNANHENEPKTPDRTNSTPPLKSPSTNNLYRLKRRSRPAIDSLFNVGDQSLTDSSELPISSVEDSANAHLPTWSSDGINLLGAATGTSRKQAPSSPHTPQPCHGQATTSISDSHYPAGLLSRPLSACSILSDSSDDSSRSLVSYPAGDGSCTSLESDTPARRSSINRKNLYTPANWYEPGLKSSYVRRPTPSHDVWTEEMDWHLWSTYLRYLQDPTMTPFKMLPGVAPPLGVCYRVTREARKSWAITKHRKSTPPYLQTPGPVQASGGSGNRDESLGKPLTGRRICDSNATPTTLGRASSIHQWPKSGSSTRRRLRHLCKHRPSIAPHYQRLLQSRTPSPFSSSQSPNGRSRSQLSEISSSTYESSATFSTRDVQLSLTTSTGDTMQPDGPLAQLAMNPASFQKRDFEDFNEPPVPFASDISAPSDLESLASPFCSSNAPQSAPRLGSPFTHHTWGPSHTKQRTRPRVQRNFASDLATIRNSHGSELQLIKGAQSSSLHKRRALHHPGDTMQYEEKNVEEGLPPYHLETATEPSRDGSGLGLRDSKQHPLQSLFATPLDPGLSNPSLNAPMGSLDSAQVDHGGGSLAFDHSLSSPIQVTAPRRVRKPLQLFVPAGMPSPGHHLSDSRSTNES